MTNEGGMARGHVSVQLMGGFVGNLHGDILISIEYGLKTGMELYLAARHCVPRSMIPEIFTATTLQRLELNYIGRFTKSTQLFSLAYTIHHDKSRISLNFWFYLNIQVTHAHFIRFQCKYGAEAGYSLMRNTLCHAQSSFCSF